MQKESKKTSLWRGNEQKPKQAGLWTFIEEHSSRLWPNESYLLTFITTIANPTKLEGRIGERNIQITTHTISKALHIPGPDDGLPLKAAKHITLNEAKRIFSRDFTSYDVSGWHIALI